MPRSVPEWKGKTDNTPIPPRVKLRILERQEDHCLGCGRLFDAKLTPVFDHRPALINGGENRETKIEAICETCHAPRTRADVAEKSKVATKRKKARGIKARKGRPMFGTIDSGWKRTMDGRVMRR